MQLSVPQLHLCLIDTINSASSEWNSWPSSQTWCTCRPHHLIIWQVHPSRCPGQISSNHTCSLPSSHTPNSVHQKITCPCLGSASKNLPLLTSCTATMLATTSSYMCYYNSIALPTSTFPHVHPPKKFTLLFNVSCFSMCKTLQQLFISLRVEACISFHDLLEKSLLF